MSLVLQSILSGLVNGVVYALIGVGMSVIFKGSRVINAMQGEFSVVGAMFSVLLLAALKVPYPVAIAGGVAAGAVLGVLIDIAFVRPMMRRGASEESYLLLTVGLASALSAAVLYFGGRDSHLLPAIGSDAIHDVGSATIREHALWLLVVALAVVGALKLFYQRTVLGLSMAAASIDPDGATTLGIDVRRMRTLTFALGGALGAIVGILFAPLVAVNYALGLTLTLKGFAAAIIGGLANPLGAVAGGLVLGLAESLAVVVFPSGYRDAVALALLVLIMLVLPNGLLGRAARSGG